MKASWFVITYASIYAYTVCCMRDIPCASGLSMMASYDLASCVWQYSPYIYSVAVATLLAVFLAVYNEIMITSKANIVIILYFSVILCILLVSYT